MTAALVALTLGMASAVVVVATIVRQVLADNRRLTAALLAPTPEAAQRALLAPERAAKRQAPDEGAEQRPAIIGLD